MTSGVSCRKAVWIKCRKKLEGGMEKACSLKVSLEMGEQRLGESWKERHKRGRPFERTSSWLGFMGRLTERFRQPTASPATGKGNRKGQWTLSTRGRNQTGKFRR